MADGSEKVAGSGSLRTAQNWDSMRSLGETFVKQSTAIGCL